VVIAVSCTTSTLHLLTGEPLPDESDGAKRKHVSLADQPCREGVEEAVSDDSFDESVFGVVKRFRY